MKPGRALATLIVLLTVLLVALGTVWPNRAAVALAVAQAPPLRAPSSPEAAIGNLLGRIGRRDFKGAYSSLANGSEFSEQDFENDLAGSHGSLRQYAMLSGSESRPLHSSADAAEVQLVLHWSTVVGEFDDARTVAVRRKADRWQVAWPIVREPKAPPQVIPVNYLRWDVIYRSAGDDWGAQDVDSPHVRIVDMHPIERGNAVIILGELINEDVVPAYVEVKATLLAKDGSALATEDSFDKISHVLLPKQVSPFRVDFPGMRLSQIDSVRMQPSANLIAASADPVIEIADQQLTGPEETALIGKLVNQSGQIVNIAHTLGTFYDRQGQVVWVSDGYTNQALLPQTPVPFALRFPSDLRSKVNSYRVVTSAYSSDRFQ